MTKEDKNLLVSEIFARTPYGVKVQIEIEDGIFEDNIVTSLVWDEGCKNWRVNDYLIDHVKLYLTPLLNFFDIAGDAEWTQFCGELDFNQQREYCNKYHIDCNGMIGKNLAITR